MNTTNWLSFWQLGLIGLLTSAAINAFTCKTLAQTTPSNIQPDATLGAESSRILENQNFRGLPIEEIRGGAIRGINLFHSFREFNVSEGRGAYFFSPGADIQNILARVTGANPSEILGILGTFGNSQPNLYLINPNGIIFGKNASLDLQGSFVGTTANGVQFGNQGNFSATNPEPVPLLTINPSALFFNRINQNAAIQNNSYLAQAGTDPAGLNAYGLRVPDGKSLLLVGGNVSMDGGELNAYGGRVELGGLAAPGNVNLVFNGDNLSLKFPENVTRADVSLTNQARVYVQAAGGGDIAINARNIDILGGSQLGAGIGTGLGTPETVAGDITLNATGEIKVADFGSRISNLVREDSKGNGGKIFIDSSSFLLTDGAQLIASTIGQGNAGNVTVSAKNAVSLANADIFSTVGPGGVGKGGNIDINAATLSLTDGAQLLTRTRGASATQPGGRGDAGNVNVKVNGAVDIAGVKNGIPSGISSYVDTGTVGNGGNITIDAGSLSLRDGAELNASTYGQGNAGNVTVIAKDAVSLAGNAYIFSTVEAGGLGKGGNIDINAARLSLTDGAQVQTFTREASDTQPAGRGDAGNVNVKVTGAVDIAGKKNGLPSAIFSSVETGTVGNGGNITIDSASFSLRDGAQLIASTSGQGNAGNVTVRAKDAVSLAGLPTAIFSTVEAGGVGKGGNITIDAATLSLTDAAQLITITRGASATQPAGRGDAGNVNVKVTGAVDIAGVKNGISSGIRSLVNIGTIGNGGNITIDSGSFSLRDGAKLNASTSGQGNAGNVTVGAKDAVSLAGNAYIFSTVEAGSVGKGGNININAATLSLTDGAQLLTATLGASATQPAGRGDAGNVNVKVTGAVDIAGVKNGIPSGIGSLVDTGTVGNGGNITIDAGDFSLRDSAELNASTGGQGNAGNIRINAKDGVTVSGTSQQTGLSTGLFVSSTSSGITGDIEINSPKVTLDNQATLNAESASGNGGNININSDLLLLRHGSQISTTAGTAEAGGDGGNININSKFIIAVPEENSDITANAFTGKGGNINITSQGIFGIEPRPQLTDKSDITASSKFGVSGNIQIISPDNSGLQNALIQISPNAIDTNALIAGSCIARANKKQQNSFYITGGGALPSRPGNSRQSIYTTGEVRNIPSSNQRAWKKGDQIIEATGVYFLDNGQILLSRECE